MPNARALRPCPRTSAPLAVGHMAVSLNHDRKPLDLMGYASVPIRHAWRDARLAGRRAAWLLQAVGFSAQAPTLWVASSLRGVSPWSPRVTAGAFMM